MNRPPTIIKMQGIGKSYPMGQGLVHALKKVNFEIHAGESVAIMGPSGSGKSTLLHLLGCLDLPTQGHYFLDGQDVSALSDEELSFIRVSKIGFVFQSFNLIPQLNVFENIEVPFLYRNSSSKEIQARVLVALKRVGLSHRSFHRPNELSGGETQRVAIARALAIHPLLILADEPTGNLDTETGNSILHLFKELNLQGVTLIIVTHDEHVSTYCQRLIRMRDGMIVSDERQGS